MSREWPVTASSGFDLRSLTADDVSLVLVGGFVLIVIHRAVILENGPAFLGLEGQDAVAGKALEFQAGAVVPNAATEGFAARAAATGRFPDV